MNNTQFWESQDEYKEKSQSYVVLESGNKLKPQGIKKGIFADEISLVGGCGKEGKKLTNNQQVVHGKTFC